MTTPHEQQADPLGQQAETMDPQEQQAETTATPATAVPPPPVATVPDTLALAVVAVAILAASEVRLAPSVVAVGCASPEFLSAACARAAEGLQPSPLLALGSVAPPLLALGSLAPPPLALGNDAAQSDDEDKSQSADTDGGKLKQKTTQFKKFLGKSVKRAKHLAEEYGEKAVNKVKSVRDEVFHTDQDDPSSSDDEGMPYTRPVKFKAAHGFKGPFDFDQIKVVQDLSGEHMVNNAPEDPDLDDKSVPFRQQPFCKYKGHTADLLDLSWSKDDRYFLSGSLDGKLRLWNIPDKKVALWNEVDGQTRLITAANFCQNGKYAVIGTYDGRCIFYDTEVTEIRLDFFSLLIKKKKNYYYSAASDLHIKKL
ncbi:UNVERIFIED_CONTAM: hypothetical protein FKN15_063552 [Acipenser sinensis]